jgi:hypothetical protein
VASLNVGNFRAEILSKGIQVASHFDLELDFPPPQSTVTYGTEPPAPLGTDDERRLSTVTVTARGPRNQLRLRCESVSLPDLSINTIETHRFGFGTPDIVPYGLSYFETVVTFIGDQEGYVYKQFYDWINRIMKMPEAPTTKLGLPEDDPGVYEVGFKSDIVVQEGRIHAYDQNHNLIYTATLFDVFPRSLTSTSLNWAAGDELVRYTAFLSFKDFKIEFPKLSK